MKYENILEDLKNKIYRPLYFLSGEEPYFIDKISKAIETTVLTESEKDFNQVILYGRDTSIMDIISLAKEYPVFGNYRLVIVREAQNLKNIEHNDLLKSYLKNPAKSTILVFDYKYKKVDGRTGFAKLLGKVGVYFQSKKLWDNQVPDWIIGAMREKGYRISQPTSIVLAENLGNDLSKIENELNKLEINVPKGTEITPEIIEEYIGISKDYNIFELQNALGKKDALKVNRIINYFGSTPKENPAIRINAILFGFFKKVFLYHSLKDKSENNVAAQLSLNRFFVKDYRIAAANYSEQKLRNVFSVLREYDLKSKGVEAASMEDGEIMREMVFKILH
jgi:DNA polymerase-3 subunit delta